jgi:Na+/glutamate symporter
MSNKHESNKPEDLEEEVVEVIDIPDIPEQANAQEAPKEEPEGAKNAKEQAAQKCAADFAPNKAMKDEKHHSNVAMILAILALILLMIGRFGVCRIPMYICAFVIGLIAFVLDYRTKEHSRKVVTGLVLSLLAVVLSLYSCASLPSLMHRSSRSFFIEEIYR